MAGWASALSADLRLHYFQYRCRRFWFFISAMISIVIAVVVEVVLAFSDRNVIGFDIRTTEGYIAGCCRVRYPPGGVRPFFTFLLYRYRLSNYPNYFRSICSLFRFDIFIFISNDVSKVSGQYPALLLISTMIMVIRWTSRGKRNSEL